ncbi:MAG: Rieske (2Fe-2S) protein [Candidatus Bathyarchaeia archaeon]
MFKNPPRALAHVSATEFGHYVTKDRIITEPHKVYSRECPHKYYPLGQEGESLHELTCKLHGFEFDSVSGKGTNNPCKMHYLPSSVGKSGIIYENFTEPNHWCFEKIAGEKALYLAETTTGSSTGSWLWNMDMEVDILHLRKDGIHPWLAANYTKEEITYENGDGWVLQAHKHGFWLLIFPFTFIEYSPGCLGVKTVTPNYIKEEFGFTWNTQIYFSPGLDTKTKQDFLKLKDVYYEDVAAIELIKRPYYPQYSADPYEKQNQLFADWFYTNR